MKPGRTYYIDYIFYAADGYEISEEFSEENTEFICGKGCEVIWFGKTTGTGADGKPLNSLSVYTKVHTGGNFFQNFFGGIADLILKIKSWSLY